MHPLATLVPLGICWLTMFGPVVDSTDDLEDAIATVHDGASDTQLIDAVKLLKASDDPRALRAVDDLVELCDHENSLVRREAVLALGLVLGRNEQPCHLAIVRAMGDGDEAVRMHAADVLGFFAQSLPVEAGPMLVERAQSRDGDIRAQAVSLLGYCPGNEELQRAVLRQALYDEDILVRNNAVAALLVSKCELREVLPHSLLILETPIPDGLSELKQSRHEICKISQAFRVKEMGEEQPEVIVPALIRSLNDDSELVRGAAARNLGALWSETPSCRPVLRKHRARMAVHALIDDESDSVRENVLLALSVMPED